MSTPGPLASRLRPLSCAALSLALAAPAVARSLTIETDPGAPTWRERARVTVRGLTATACGAEAVRLEGPRQELFHEGPYFVTFDLVESCASQAPPIAVPFAVSATLWPLVPRTYTLRVRDLASGETTAVPLAVYEQSPLALELPVATSAAPAVARVSGWADCYGIDAVRVEGRTIEMDYSAGCYILPPGESVFEFDQELGFLEPGAYEVRLFDHFHTAPFGRPTLARGVLQVRAAGACLPGPGTLCLHDGRFRVSAEWADFGGATGGGVALPVGEGDGSGAFWFFAPESVELTFRVLDACGVNGRFWVFLAGGSTVGYEVEVTDTRTGAVRRYAKPLHEVPRLVADTGAFACP